MESASTTEKSLAMLLKEVRDEIDLYRDAFDETRDGALFLSTSAKKASASRAKASSSSQKEVEQRSKWIADGFKDL